MVWDIRLIILYLYICDLHKNELWVYCQRFSNNSSPKFTDEEVIVIFLWGIMHGHTEIKYIYRYADQHLRDWFPDLPSYEAYIQRLNRLSDVFPPLVEELLKSCPISGYERNIRLIDSMPIIMASEKRSGSAKVAQGFANKGYCSSKGIYYYGVKLHVLGIKRKGTLPLPEFAGLSPANRHDLPVFAEIAPYLHGKDVYADKAYISKLMKETLENQEVELLTPAKKEKGQERLFMFEQLLSTSVSQMRQPIESLFSWIQQKTKIQIASKVRSYKGLMVHVFGRFAAAMFMLAFNS